MEVTVPESKVLPKISLPGPKTVVLIADILVDFVSRGGKLFVPDTQKTIGSMRSLTGKARKGRATVIYIQDWHRPDDPEFSICGPHAIQDTPGIRVMNEMANALAGVGH